MSLVNRVFESVKDQGLLATLLKVTGPLADRQFDRRYGVETCEQLPVAELDTGSVNKTRAEPYEPSRVLPVRRALGHVRKMIRQRGAFVDFGCGKGRVLLLAAEQGFQPVRGIEFAGALCALARQNVASFNARAPASVEIEIMEGDAAAYSVRPDDHIFFFFNPFDAFVFSAVLNNIAASLRAHPRRVLIVLIRPRDHFRRTLAAHAGFSLVRQSQALGTPFLVYESECEKSR